MNVKSGFNNYLKALREADIHDLNALDKMSGPQFSHFLKSINADSMAEGSNLTRAKQLINSQKKQRFNPQVLAANSAANQGARPQKETKMNEQAKSAVVRSIDPSFRAPNAAAIFDINVTRLTHAINQTLYVALFGPLDYQSSYNQVITDLNPGVTWTVELMTNKRGLKFTFTDGVGTDIVNVECSQVAYVNLLRACQGSLLRMEQNKMNISDATAQTQFAASVWIIKNSLFGKLEKDSFTPNQFKTDLQNQNDIRIITVNWDVDQETTLAIPMVDGFTALQLNITSFISRFETSRA